MHTSGFHKLIVINIQSGFLDTVLTASFVDIIADI